MTERVRKGFTPAKARPGEDLQHIGYAGVVEKTYMISESDVQLIAEIIQGTQVLRSMGMLGTATTAWDKLRDLTRMFGWMDVEATKAKLIEYFERQESEAVK